MTRERIEQILTAYTKGCPSRRATALSEVRTAYAHGALATYQRDFAPHLSAELALLIAAWRRALVCVDVRELTWVPPAADSHANSRVCA